MTGGEIAFIVYLVVLAGGLSVAIAAGSLRYLVLRWKALYIVGVVLAMISFWGLAWVRFTPWEYITAIPNFVQDKAPEILDWVVNLIGADSVKQVWRLISTQILRLSGPWTVVVMLTMSQVASLARADTILPMAFLGAVAGLLWVGLATPVWWVPAVIRPRSGFARWGGVILASFAAATACLLVSSIPDIDALGSSGSFELGLLAALMGARVGEGVWWSLLGLLFLVAAGIAEVIVPQTSIAGPLVEPGSHPRALQPALRKGGKPITTPKGIPSRLPWRWRGLSGTRPRWRRPGPLRSPLRLAALFRPGPRRRKRR